MIWFLHSKENKAATRVTKGDRTAGSSISVPPQSEWNPFV